MLISQQVQVLSINDDVRIIMRESSVQFSSYTMSDSSLVRHCSMLHFRCTLLKSKPTEAPQEKKKTLDYSSLFWGTNKTVSFRPSVWLLPQHHSASVTCIIVRSQKHSPPVAMTKCHIIKFKSLKRPSGCFQNNSAPMNFQFMNIDEWIISLFF